MMSHQEVNPIPVSLLSSNVQTVFETSQKAHRAMHEFSLAMKGLVEAIWDLNITYEVKKAMSLDRKDDPFLIDPALDALNRACWAKAINAMDIARFRKDRLIRMYNDENQKIPYFWFEGPECLERLQSDPEEALELEKRVNERLLNPRYKSSKDRYEKVQKTLTAVDETTRLRLFEDSPATHDLTALDEFQWLEDLERLLHQKRGAANDQRPLVDVVKEQGDRAPLVVERAAFSFQIFKNGNAEIKIKPVFLAALNGAGPEIDQARMDLHRMLTEEMPADIAQAVIYKGVDREGLRYDFKVNNVEGSVWSFPNFAYVKLGKDEGVKARGTAADRFRGICNFLQPLPDEIADTSESERDTPPAEGEPAAPTEGEVKAVQIVPVPLRIAADYTDIFRAYLDAMPATPTLKKSTLSPKVEQIQRLSKDLLEFLEAGIIDQKAASLLVAQALGLREEVTARRTEANATAIDSALVECETLENLGHAVVEMISEIGSRIRRGISEVPAQGQRILPEPNMVH